MVDQIAPVVISGKAGEVIDELRVFAQQANNDSAASAGWMCVIAADCDGLRIGKLVLIGAADDSGNKVDWLKTMCNGVSIRARGVVIDVVQVERVHVGVDVAADGVVIDAVYARLLSGDVVQGKGNYCCVGNVTASELLTVRDETEYHPDVIQWRGDTEGVGIRAVQVVQGSHQWARHDYQGILFTDGAAKSCRVDGCRLPGVHPEHGVTFAEAHDCTVTDVWGGGAVRFRALRGVQSTRCAAADCDGVVEGAACVNGVAVMDKVFDPTVELGLPADVEIPVGLLLNNPMAIKRFENWRGQIKPGEEPAFMRGRRNDLLRFTQPEWGIRCGVHILLNKQRRGVKSVRGLILEWSPVGEENSKSAVTNYVAHVSSRVGVQPDDLIAISDYEVAKKVVLGIIEVENGWLMPYSDEQIDAGLALAGIKMPEEAKSETKPPMQSAERKGAVLIGTGSVGGVVTTALVNSGLSEEQASAVVRAAEGAASQVQALSNTADWVFWLTVFNAVCWVAVLAGAGWWFYGRGVAAKLGLR